MPTVLAYIFKEAYTDALKKHFDLMSTFLSMTEENENLGLYKNWHTNVHRNFICNSLKL